MPRPRKHAPGEIWQYTFPDGHPAGKTIYACWMPAGARTPRRQSLGTADPEEARLKIAELILQRAGRLGTGGTGILIPGPTGPVFFNSSAALDPQLDVILLAHWSEHASKSISRGSARANWKRWTKYWPTGTRISDLTPKSIDRFIEWLRNEAKNERAGTPLAEGTISLILSFGRAALRRAVKQQTLFAAPFIPDVLTFQERLESEPKGRPLSLRELALWFDSCPDVPGDYFFRASLLAMMTLCRISAACELRYGTYRSRKIPRTIDLEHEIAYLNPPDRKQTKKRRAVVKMCPTLREWFDEDGLGIWIRPEGISLSGLEWAMNQMRARAGFVLHGPDGNVLMQPDRYGQLTPVTDRDINTYSIRHTMAREFRKRKVPDEEIGLMLGHRIPGHNQTTGIYAPFEPDYCSLAVAAIEDVISKVDAMMTRRSLYRYDKRNAMRPPWRLNRGNDGLFHRREGGVGRPVAWIIDKSAADTPSETR